jgi:transcriptional regulator with XRE-family HTH domain
MNDTSKRSHLGATLRALRNQRGWTLTELARRTGFSIPALSKVENDRLSLSYDKLIRLSDGLGVDIGQLFAPPASASAATTTTTTTSRRSINRRGEGELVATRNYSYRYLSADVTHKKFIPILTELHARTLEQFGELVRHTGEEFLFVLEGEIEVHTEHYAPFVLAAGESTYIDSTMGHAYIVKGKGAARLLAICSGSERDLREVMAKSTAPAAPEMVSRRPAATRRKARGGAKR